VPVDVKFCGMTRREDVAHAASLGASYVGVIFAGGPRNRSAREAAAILTDLPGSPRKVGVFADQPVDEICSIAKVAALDVVQLHGDASADRVGQLRRCFAGEVWAVARLAGEVLPVDFSRLFEAADAVLLDALVPGALGGTGTSLPWAQLADAVGRARRGRKLVLAGGLRADNVASAIAVLSPDVVDVSSGVESSVGVKDHDRMRASRDAVSGAGQADRVRSRESVRG